jgi:hypothetical protein
LVKAGKTENGKKLDPFTPEEMLSVINSAETASPNLAQFLRDVCNESGSAPSAVCDFLMCIASTSPVCSYIHYDESVHSLIMDISSGVNIKRNPSKWSELRSKIPVVFKLLCDNTVDTVPLSLSNLLVELWNRCEETFAFVEAIVADGDIVDDDLSFFPNLPKCRNRGLFAADTVKGGRKAEMCTKQYRGHPTLLPGIFTLYCQHGRKDTEYFVTMFISRL